MEFNRVKKQIILALFVALIPTSTVYPAWGWSSFTASLSTVVSQLLNKASSALSEVSPKVAAVGAVLTAGVVAGVYWFKKKNREIEKLKLEKASYLAGEARESHQRGSLESELKRLKAQNDSLEQQLKKRADMVDVATQTDFDQYEPDRKYLEEQADEQWTRIEFLTPEVIKQKIEALKNDYEQLYQCACNRCPVDQLADKTKNELDKIKLWLEQKKSEIATKKANLHLIISARTGTVSELHDCLKREYDANSRVIQEKAGIRLYPDKYYNHLGVDQADGFNMSSGDMMVLINQKKNNADGSALWVLRQLGYVFGTRASKEHFDAFLHGKTALKQLLFDKTVAQELLDAFATITESQMGIEEYLSQLTIYLRQCASKSNTNGKTGEDNNE